MSVQMPQRPESIKPSSSVDLTPIQPNAAPAPLVTLTDRAASTAARVSLSHTARLADAFQARQSAQATHAGLVRTHAILDAAHVALQRESHIYDRSV